MRKIFAIAGVSLRNAIRSKVVVCLVALLLVVNFGLPLTIKGDGTAAGYLRIILSYTLGLVMFILSLTTLWTGCAAISLEINDKTAQMVAAKPVSTWQLWLGKWIGLTALNTALLILCGIVMYVLLQVNVHHDPAMKSSPLMSARDVLQPAGQDFTSAALHELEKLSIADPAEAAERFKAILQRMRFEANMVEANESRSWTLGPMAPTEPGATITLAYRFSSSALGQGTVRGSWVIGTATQPAIVSMERISSPRSVNEITFPYDARWTGQPVMITYIHQDPGQSSLIFDPADGIRLLVPRDSFHANYFRAMLVLWGQLAFLGAIGVTAGALFSLPVASLVGLFLLLLVQMSGYIQQTAQTEQFIAPQHHHHHEGESHDHAHGESEIASSWITTPLRIIFKGLALLVHPLTGENVLDALAGGYRIGWSTAWRGAGLQGIVYALGLGLLASNILKRRELALPGV